MLALFKAIQVGLSLLFIMHVSTAVQEPKYQETATPSWMRTLRQGESQALRSGHALRIYRWIGGRFLSSLSTFRQTLLVSFNVPHVAILAVLSVFAPRHKTGLVMDSWDVVSHTVPI